MNVAGELWKREVGEFFFDDFFYNGVCVCVCVLGEGGIVDKYPGKI